LLPAPLRLSFDPPGVPEGAGGTLGRDEPPAAPFRVRLTLRGTVPGAPGRAPAAAELFCGGA
jgi:hypothetical protein